MFQLLNFIILNHSLKLILLFYIFSFINLIYKTLFELGITSLDEGDFFKTLVLKYELSQKEAKERKLNWIF